jgi:C-1 hydroxylase
MSLEKNKAIIHKAIEALNERNVDALDELFASDCVDHTRQLQGLEAVKQYMTMLCNSFPDFHGTIEDIIAEGDKVWVRVTYTGTHTGELQGLAPTGEKIKNTSIDVYRIADSKVRDGWSFLELYSHLAFFKKLGVINYKGFPDEAK